LLPQVKRDVSDSQRSIEIYIPLKIVSNNSFITNKQDAAHLSNSQILFQFFLKCPYSLSNGFGKGCSFRRVHRISNAIPTFLFENNPLAERK